MLLFMQFFIFEVPRHFIMDNPTLFFTKAFTSTQTLALLAQVSTLVPPIGYFVLHNTSPSSICCYLKNSQN